MAIKSLTLLLLLAIVSFDCSVSEETDCTLPWFGRVNSERDVEKLGFIGETKYVFTNICPTPLIGDPNKKYCCYNIHGDVECCDLQEFYLMGFICIIPILIIILMLCCFICKVCCACCFCRRRQSGRILGTPSAANYVFVEALPNTLAHNHPYYSQATTGSAPLIPNEFPLHKSY